MSVLLPTAVFVGKDRVGPIMSRVGLLLWSIAARHSEGVLASLEEPSLGPLRSLF